MSMIKTPDQRLRVFISSTINELKAERRSARSVIVGLHLIPVFFESGARPYPAMELYRSYLDQSDIFIGIYWKSYGWTAPDMDISGLEDEWKLSGNKPKLVYIKHASDRDPKLDALLADIQNSDTLCYQKFETPEELAELLANDLAILLTERFQSAVPRSEGEDRKRRTNLPALRNELIGRSAEMEQLSAKLAIPELGLVTLTGPGGTGKTRLSLELGKRLIDKFEDGVYFVSLGTVTESSRVPFVIAQSLGMNNNSNRDVSQWLLEYLFDKSMLLILDNFEQITGGGMLVSKILNKCPKVKIIVTSRTPLYIRNENIFPVNPLAINPFTPESGTKHAEAVELFIHLANESNPSITWNEKNIVAAYSICKKVDGLPLAIELTAARCRHLDPFHLDKKLNTLLDSNLPSPLDYPERQQTLRSTIQWSYDLLDTTDQRLFRRLSVFLNGWSYLAVEKICWEDFGETEYIDISLERLVDFGLVVKTSSDYNCFRLLKIIKEYSHEKLVEAGEEDQLKGFHCTYFQQLALVNAQKTWEAVVDTSHLQFREDYENAVAALQYALEIKDDLKILSLINYLNALYMMTGEIGYLFELLEKANIKSDEEGIKRLLVNVPKPIIAICLLSTGFTRSTTGNFEEGLRDLSVSRQFAEEHGILPIEAFTLLFMGMANVTMCNFVEARKLLTRSIALNKQLQQLPGQLTGEIALHVTYLEENDIATATALLDNAIEKTQTGFMPLVQSFALYERAYLHFYLKEYEPALQRFLESTAINQKYNLNMNASFGMLGEAMLYTALKQFDLAVPAFRRAMDCQRMSGNDIEFECYKYACCYYLAASGQTDNATKLYSHIRSYLDKTNFRPWITQYCCLEYSYELLPALHDAAFLEKCIANAEELSREEIYAMIG